MPLDPTVADLIGRMGETDINERIKMITRIVISLVVAFLTITGVYLIVTGQTIEGTYYYPRSGRGWIHSSLNGYYLLIMAACFLVAAVYGLRKRKLLNPDRDRRTDNASGISPGMIKKNTITARYPLNKGDFYINNETCLACGAPQAEAPDIIEHEPNNHCYFKKQPTTEDEIDQAIKAMMVSCIDALRYGGQDEQLLKRLYEAGIGHLCDYKPTGRYHILIRDRVQFRFEDTFEAFELFLVPAFKSMWPAIRIEDYQNNSTDSFSFAQRWMPGINGAIYTGQLTGDHLFEIKVSREKDSDINDIVGFSVMLYDILKTDNRVTDMIWFEHGKQDGTGYRKPF